MLGNIGWMELLLFFGVMLLIFGARRIPEIARSLGKATREFKNARDDVITKVQEANDDVPKDEKKKVNK